MKNNNVTAHLKELSTDLNIQIDSLLTLSDLGGLTAEIDVVEELSSRLEQLKKIVDNIPLI